MTEPNEDDPSRNRPWDKARRDSDDDSPRRRDRDRDDDDDFDDRPRRRRGEPKASSGLPVVWIVVGVVVLVLLVLGGVGLLLFPAIQKVRDSAARMKDQNNLKQISLGVMNYHDTHGSLPPVEDDLSWRVHILPYIEQVNVYNQFDPKQPWNSPANKRLANQRIPQYLSASDPPEMVETRYRVFVGPGTLFEPGKPPLPLREVRDGSGSTIFVVEAAESVPWPQPKELQYDRNGPLPALGVPGRKGFNAAMLDGSVKFVSDTVSSDVIRGGIEPNDGRRFDP